MTFKADFYAALNVTGVSDLVAGRIYPGIAPQEAAKPYIVWRRNGGDPMAVMSGSGSRSITQVVVFACAEKYDDCAAIAEAVRDALKAAVAPCKCNSVGLPIDGFDETTRLLTTAIEAAVFHRPT